MSLKRRLSRLEDKPQLPPNRQDITCPKMERILQKKLALPLPEDATDEERADCLRLIQAAQERLRTDRADTGGLNEVRRYTLSLHSKYATDPYWGESSPFE